MVSERCGLATISFFGTGIRTERWMELYDSIAQDGIDFDLTEVGPNEPDYKLPDNFYFIKSAVKPTQCVEIGFRSVKSDLIIPVADDEIFYPGAIASVYKQYCELNDEMALISFRYCLKGVDLSEGASPAMRYYVWDPTSPLAPICPLMTRKLWADTGSIDSRFVAIYWDLAIGMRMVERGAKGYLSPDAKIEEFGANPDGGDHILYDKYGPLFDRRILDSFWTLPPIGTGQIQKKRMAPVEPFVDKDILTITQGVKGEWT